MERDVPMHERGIGGNIAWVKWLLAALLIVACAAVVWVSKPWEYGQSTEKKLRATFIAAQKAAVAEPSDVGRLTDSYNAGKALADYYTKVGAIKRARDVLKISAQSLEALVMVEPTVIRYKVNLAIAKETLGILSNRLGDLSQAEQDFRTSVAVWQEVSKLGGISTDDKISRLDIQNGLAGSLFNLASFLDMHGKYDSIEALYKQSIVIREQISREQPSAMTNWIELTRTMRSLGILYHKFSWFKQSEEKLNECIELQSKLARSNPKWADLRDQLGITYNVLGGLCSEQQRYERAEQLFLEAVRIFEQLTVNYPDSGKFKEGYASALTSLANIYYLQERVEDARPLYAKAHQSLLALVKLAPGSLGFKDKLAASHYNLGQVNEDLDNINEASRNYVQALSIQRELAERFPNNPGYRHAMATTLHARGRLEQLTERNVAAERTFGEAREIWHRLVEDYPNDAGYRMSLSNLYGDFANLCASMNDTARASNFRELSKRVRAVPGIRN